MCCITNSQIDNNHKEKNMIIEKVNNINDAKKCNYLLTKLLISESKYDKNYI